MSEFPGIGAGKLAVIRSPGVGSQLGVAINQEPLPNWHDDSLSRGLASSRTQETAFLLWEEWRGSLLQEPARFGDPK